MTPTPAFWGGLHLMQLQADLNEAVNNVCGKHYETCNLQLYHNVHFTTAGKQFCAVELSNAVAPLLAPAWLKICKSSPDGSKWC